MGERQKELEKGNKNLSGDGEEGEEGGESRVLNSPKAFGELIMIIALDSFIAHCVSDFFLFQNKRRSGYDS